MHGYKRTFCKKDPLLRAGEQGVALDELVENLDCTSDLGCIQDGDSILIVDDVLSIGLSVDSMKTKIIRSTDSLDLKFMGAAILKV